MVSDSNPVDLLAGALCAAPGGRIGRGLAALHRHGAPCFGLQRETLRAAACPEPSPRG